MTSLPAYTIDDIIGDVTDLHQLIEATRQVLIHMDYGNPDCRNRQLDRVASLTNIASRLSGRIAEDIDNNFAALAGKAGVE